ncbi:hypothetical protein K438DRAFT_1942563 [Mycena galopus ATCC 62051]|nr:hypothetical protein K438DRAFT_1942563 [Mycena galopus ATCC 62051]
MFTCANTDDSAVPYIVDSDYSRAFFAEVLKKDYSDILQKFEQWACNRDSGEHDRNDLDSMRKDIAQMILDTLRTLKNDQKLLMDYVNYLVVIVHGLGVRLAGWPETIAMVHLSKLSADDTRIIRAKLRSGAIKWVVLTKRERTAVAKEVDELREQGPLRPQKERSDKGSKRGPYRKRGAKRSDDSDDESDDDDEESPSSSVSQSTASKAPAASTSTASPSSMSPSASAASVSTTSPSTASAPPTGPASSPSVAVPAASAPAPSDLGLLGPIPSSYYDPFQINYDDLNFSLTELPPLPLGQPLIPTSWDLMVAPNGPLYSLDNEARGSDTAGLRLNISNAEDVAPVASSSSTQVHTTQTTPMSSSVPSTGSVRKRGQSHEGKKSKRPRKENAEGDELPKPPRKKRSDAGVKKGPRMAKH